MTELLAALPAHQRELFELRAARWWPDLRAGLGAVYAPEVAARLEGSLLHLAAAAHVERVTATPDLARLNLVRTLQPDRFQAPRMLGYAACADRSAGDLAGVARRIPYQTAVAALAGAAPRRWDDGALRLDPHQALWLVRP
ncbi:hypothetical protein SAMN05428996_0703 [Quadrisphaera sp. DSM 44207]|nr:hypothetical protein SAMN05428996_0703 [Quadrisphaera sp. DSM 44207]